MSNTTMASSSPSSDSTALPQSWVLWYHDPNNSDYSLNSYIKISGIVSAQHFWTVVEAISPEAWNSGMFFLMREGIRPLWDAPENDKGGAWSKKIDATETRDVFLDCMVHCLAEKMLTKQNECIAGVTLSPKGQFHIIKIWNLTTAVHDRKFFNAASLKMKIGDDIAYKAHNLRPK
jgi:hypothetical protein